ncbi:MAG: tRNA (N(6)-L-threonylcarbamoyladenosine(37)-C(2))-methylthiotransferase MtaB [Gemmatimonadota bacterium]|nr:tRNA (N(6)-L-threonylcarbamoyladenosine(37)-C(2))-methylthiotransferase MtaB [Gemmatimonadota bacterium]
MNGNVKTVSFYTLGCKLNTYDTEWYREQFRQEGYHEVAFGRQADVTVVNTCTVTGQGAAQSRQMLRRAHRVSPEGTVVAMGCYAQTDPDVLTEMPEVDLVVGTAEKTRLLDLINDTCSIGRSYVTRRRTAEFQEMDIFNFGGRARAFVKIQEGCNEFCSFCIIPFARGRSRSRSLRSCLDQVRRLVDAGYQEVVLAGVHIGDYGADLDGHGLLDLFEGIERIEGLRRFRVSSIEASYISDAMVDFFSSSSRFCRHLHIPLQSGDDGILTSMRRPYTRARYLSLIETLAERVPGIGLGADVMVGFPGETDGAFANTFDLVEKGPLAFLHVFPFSPRAGTFAARMGGEVDAAVKKRRGVLLRRLGERKTEAFNRRFEGRTMDVLFEDRREPETGYLQGVTGNYIRVFAPGPDSAKNAVAPVRLTDVRPGRVIGSMADVGPEICRGRAEAPREEGGRGGVLRNRC